MHPPELKAEALRLVEAGLNDCEISRRMGIPRPTIRDWRRPTYVPKTPVTTCPRCGEATKKIHFSIGDYAELLGMYLGDGCISRSPRAQRLRIFLDKRYPQIINDTRELLERFFPSNQVHIQDMETWVIVSVYHRHLGCLFPQHGAGKKHQRAIALEVWQWALLNVAPWPFIRGCIRTDGAAFVNRTGPYEYLSYHFANKSKDIALILSTALDMVGVRHRLTDGGRRQLWQLRVNRRPDVALMLENVGVKT